MGAVVTTRPDALVIYFGHNNVWDIRIAENHKEEIKNFDYVFNRVKDIPSTVQNLTDDPWYLRMCAWPAITTACHIPVPSLAAPCCWVSTGATCR
jgi:hypothetical protein